MPNYFKSLIIFFKKAFAFIRRDFLIQTSYRLNFFVHWASILISILTLYYLSMLFGKQANPYLVSYGGDYFSFVIIGVAAASYVGTSLSSFSSTISHEQLCGTLEIMLSTPTKISTIVFSLSLYNFILATINVLIYLIIGIFFLGLNFTHANHLAVFIILFLTILSLSSIGIISAAFTILFKKGDPLVSLMYGLSWFLGGVYFPVTIFPKYLQVISYCLPITYALRSLRMAIFKGYSVNLLRGDIIILLCFSVVLLPLSLFIFKWSIRLAKKSGSLAFY
ncbi:MAG: ABC transporter permease [Candidatus Omnitrophota bacterium]|nr:ABC transporter permease [Candidatus Omnitrophota bacterium]